MNIYEFTDYRRFLDSRLRSAKGGGRGQRSRLAEVLGVHSTFVSLVLREKRDFSLEQGLLLARHWGFSDAETEYFLDLVQLSRCGHHQMREYTKKKIKAAQDNAKKLVSQFDHERQLDAEERQVFYSSWHYSAIRIFTSTAPAGRSLEEICDRLSLPRPTAITALQFLERVKLVVREGEKYLVGPQRTFLEKGHPLLKCHHANWRLKALQQYESLGDDEMMFTTTISLSKADFSQLRNILGEFVKTTANVIKETDPEDVACVNLDLFWIR